MIGKNIMTYLGFDSDYEEAELVIFGAPYDGTTSFRPGTRFGPAAARQEFFGLESYSPYLDRCIEDRNLFDGGDLDFPFGNRERVLDEIYHHVKQLVADGKKTLMIGGEHLVTLPAIKAMAEKHPDLHILHFDAHADLRDDYMDETLSHATVLRRCWDILGDGRIFQFGIRSGSQEEIYWGKDHIQTELFGTSTFASVVASLKNKPVYLTIDLDVLDPSVFPGTGTLEPGGITFKELMDCIVKITGLNIVGADIVELSPHYDHSGVSTAVACKVIREVVLAITEGR